MAPAAIPCLYAASSALRMRPANQGERRHERRIGNQPGSDRQAGLARQAGDAGARARPRRLRTQRRVDGCALPDGRPRAPSPRQDAQIGGRRESADRRRRARHLLRQARRGGSDGGRGHRKHPHHLAGRHRAGHRASRGAQRENAGSDGRCRQRAQCPRAGRRGEGSRPPAETAGRSRCRPPPHRHPPRRRRAGPRRADRRCRHAGTERPPGLCRAT